MRVVEKLMNLSCTRRNCPNIQRGSEEYEVDEEYYLDQQFGEAMIIPGQVLR